MIEDSLYNRLAKGILTAEEIDKLVDEIMNIPCEKNNNCLSTYGSINVDDLISNIKEFRKIPIFDNLLKENKKLKEQLKQKQDIINKVEDYIIKNNLFKYKYDEEELYEIVSDDKARTDLLHIIKNKR